MNSVQLTGRFTRDPEVKYTDGGSTIARFTLACDRRFKQQDGPSAEFIEKYFTKGMKIELNGHIQTGNYTNKEGQKVYTTDIVAENVSFAESKKSSANGREDGFGQDPSVGDIDDGFITVPDDVDEELPFN